MDSNQLPNSRSEWAALNWKNAQKALTRLLKNHQFRVYEERRLENHTRADLLVIGKQPRQTVFGILEVKSYQNVTPSLQRSAFKQGCKYLSQLYQRCENPHIYGTNPRRYFVATVYTKDYPTRFSQFNINNFSNILPSQLLDKGNIDFIQTTPDRLIKRLQKRNLAIYKQKKIDDFFD